jgi:dTDP-glucose 4,6-dehydratase
LRKLTNILVTGGCGFIGSNFIRTLLEKTNDFSGIIVNLDALTYAANPSSLDDIEKKYGGKRYFFVHADICDKNILKTNFDNFDIDTVINFAAESHVDRSIHSPETFIKTNVMGTFTLLETALNAWKSASGIIRNDVLFHHISTDEVYGSLDETGYFTESTPYDPHSPYSASKAASDHLVLAYYHTYGLPVTLSNCSNNYGPFQFPEKLIPLMILNMLDGKPLPVYGDGKNIRDWIFVEDHNRAIWTIMQKGTSGEKFNIGGENEWENIRLMHELIKIVSKKLNCDSEKIKNTITFVTDRPGHDRRYAIDCTKLKQKFGWKQTVDITTGLEKTVDWYLANKNWIDTIRNGEYKNWIDTNYNKR